MKIWRILSGVLSILLSGVIGFQSFFAGLLGAIAFGGSVGSIGFFCGLLMLVGGIVSLVTCGSKSKDSGITIAVIYGLLGVIGLLGHGFYTDLIIWSIWAIIVAGVALFSSYKRTAVERKEPDDIVTSLSTGLERIHRAANDLQEPIPRFPQQTETQPAHQRLFALLKEKEWTQAKECCERILDLNMEDAIAYMGLMMVSLQVEKPGKLVLSNLELSGDYNYQKAIGYADEEMKAFLSECNEQIKRRIIGEQREELYESLCAEMKRARSASMYELISKRFDALGEYKDSKMKAEECINLATLSAEKGAKRELVFIGLVGGAAFVGVLALCYVFIVTPRLRLREAGALLNQGEYEKAYSIYSELGKEDKIAKSKVERSNALMAAGQYAEAYELLWSIEREDLIENSKRDRISDLIKNKDYEAAYALMHELSEDDAIILSKYERGKEYLSKQQYDEAYALFEETYHLEDIAKSKYERGMALIKEEKYEAAYKLLQESFVDEVIKNKEERAKAAADSNDFYQAYTILQSIYIDTYHDEMIELIEKYKKDQFKNAEVGDIVFFGEYKCSKSFVQKYPIEWIVLERKGNQLLLLTKNIIECKEFDSRKDLAQLNWKNSELRSWLNQPFYQEAFTASEKKQVVNTKTSFVTKDSKTESTSDKIFVLSLDEIDKYAHISGLENVFVGIATKYVENRYGLPVDNESGVCFRQWWARALGFSVSSYSVVAADGTYGKHSSDHYLTANVGIRAAMWITIPK